MIIPAGEEAYAADDARNVKDECKNSDAAGCGSLFEF